MPLPPAPTKRADRVSPKAFDMPASKAPRASQKPSALALDFPAAAVIPVAATAVTKPAHKPVSRAPVAALLTESRTPIVVAPVTTRTAATARAKKRTRTGPTKLFVLDTNVLLHDPMCLFRFEEHDIYLPMIVLEELDGHKKGMTEVARNARQTSRTLDALAGAPGADITAGFLLDSTGHRDAGGKLLFQTQSLDYHLPTSLPQGKADNQILGVVEALRQKFSPREVVLVSKDINMRV